MIKKPFNSGHKTFDKQVDIMEPFAKRGKTLWGWTIRPYHERHFGGTPYAAGDLQKLDLQPIEAIKSIVRSTWEFEWKMKQVRKCAEKYFVDHHGWVYMLFHKGSGGKKIGHGIIMTNHEGKFVAQIGLGPTVKSQGVLDEAIKHLTIRPKYTIKHTESMAYKISYEFLDRYEIEATTDGITTTRPVVIMRKATDYGNKKEDKPENGVYIHEKIPYSGKHETEIHDPEWFSYPSEELLETVGLGTNTDGPLLSEIQEEFGPTFKERLKDALRTKGAKTLNGLTNGKEHLVTETSQPYCKQHEDACWLDQQ
jgi:hypothetical protein